MTQPKTPAGRALVEWAHTAFPEQESIWREHALLIEAEAAEQSVPLDALPRLLEWIEANAQQATSAPSAATVVDAEELHAWVSAEYARLLPSEPSEPAATITDEQAEEWLRSNDLFAVTHLHTPPDCDECNAALAASQPTAGEEK